MKKFLQALLLVALASILNACGGAETKAADSEASTSAEAGLEQETGGSSPAAGPGADAQVGVEHFLQNFVASAPPADPDGPEAQAAWDHLPKSRQAKLSEGEAASLHAGMSGFLELELQSDETLAAELEQYDELIREAVFRIRVVGRDEPVERILTLKKTVCDQGFATAGSVNKETLGRCEEANVQPWKITRVETPE
ncbi:MAG: hypothetical protein QF554_11110 [Dehalococcoidia bacterium]|nr:hypothetical protein [Dehalococcoidia bacterium]